MIWTLQAMALAAPVPPELVVERAAYEARALPADLVRSIGLLGGSEAPADGVLVPPWRLAYLTDQGTAYGGLRLVYVTRTEALEAALEETRQRVLALDLELVETRRQVRRARWEGASVAMAAVTVGILVVGGAGWALGQVAQGLPQEGLWEGPPLGRALGRPETAETSWGPLVVSWTLSGGGACRR